MYIINSFSQNFNTPLPRGYVANIVGNKRLQSAHCYTNVNSIYTAVVKKPTKQWRSPSLICTLIRSVLSWNVIVGKDWYWAVISLPMDCTQWQKVVLSDTGGCEVTGAEPLEVSFQFPHSAVSQFCSVIYDQLIIILHPSSSRTALHPWFNSFTVLLRHLWS